MSSLLEQAYDPPLPAQAKDSQAAEPPPIPSFQLKTEAGGVPTELLVQTFDDRILVVVTQTAKLGALVQAHMPPTAPLPLPPRPPTPGSTPGSEQEQTSTSSAGPRRPRLPPPPDSLVQTPLLGTPPDPTLHALYTNQIATLIWWTLQEVGAPRRPVVIGLALSKPTPRPGNDDDDDEGISDEERNRFYDIMDLVVRWPGPP